jgi:hypothetical protein
MLFYVKLCIIYFGLKGIWRYYIKCSRKQCELTIMETRAMRAFGDTSWREQDDFK